MHLLRVAFLALLASAVFGCGDTSPYWTQPPKDRRVCGELDGVEPVDERLPFSDCWFL